MESAQKKKITVQKNQRKKKNNPTDKGRYNTINKNRLSGRLIALAPVGGIMMVAICRTKQNKRCCSVERPSTSTAVAVDPLAINN